MSFFHLQGQTIAKTCSCNDYKEICKVWDVQWSSSANLAKEMAAAGEHRYEDSYFLKRDKASSLEHISSSNVNGKAAKRSKIEAPPSLDANCNDGGIKETASSREDCKQVENSTLNEKKAPPLIGGSGNQCSIH